jgi:Fungal fucose-specific lectin
VIGQFNPAKAPTATPARISAVAWFNSGVNIRVYWEDEEGNVLLCGWTNGWGSVEKVIGPLYGTKISAIQWNNGGNVRIYYQARSNDIDEQCNDGGAWYVGQGAARNSY